MPDAYGSDRGQDRPIVFVLGVARSGTTLLRLMLAGHSALFSPPEMVLAPFATMADRRQLLERRFWEKGGLRRTFMELEELDVTAARQRVNGLREASVLHVYQILQELLGPRILVDKCPHLCSYPEALPRLASWFPMARFLWIVRNPGSVIRSFNNVNMSEKLLDGSRYSGIEEMWREGNRVIGSFLATLPPARWTRFSYEDMILTPESVMRQVCDTLDIGFEPAMLRPYEGDRMRSGPKGARAVGDPNTAGRNQIDPKLVDSWLSGFDHRSLGTETKALALELGYDLESLPLPSQAQVSTALSGLLETVGEIERNIELPLDIDALEGRRFLLRMLSSTVDTFTEYSDADRPVLHHVIGPTRKMFGDCPDSDCLRARLRVGSGRVYRLSGRVPPSTTYLGIMLHRRGGRIGHHINDSELMLDDDGRFEVLISADDQDGTWLRCEGDETEVMIRQYYLDRASEPPVELAIELLGPTPPAGPLDAARYAKGLEAAGRMLKSTFLRVMGAYKMLTSLPIKQFHTLPGDRLFPTPDNLYQVCWYRFGPGQAFVVRGRLASARYFGFCLYNAWLESLDYTQHSICLNARNLAVEPNGTFTIILADEDPGVENWLDTAGHRAGYLLARSLLLDGQPCELTTETVWLAQLNPGSSLDSR